jgi:hypothetical protein
MKVKQMSITRFPRGVSSFGMPIMGGAILTTGTIFFVDSGHSAASNSNAGTDITQPKATIAGAMTDCTASAGDYIVVAEGHTETITAAITCDKIGVTIVGLGNGTLRPTITGTGATDGFDFTAANTRLSNFRITWTTAATTGMVNVAAAGCQVDNCHFIMPLKAEVGIAVQTAIADTMICDNYFEVTANGPNVAIDLEKSTTTGPSKTRILRNYFNGMNATNSWDEGAIESDAVCTNIEIGWNIFDAVVASKGGIELTAATTGTLHNNYVGDSTLGAGIDPGSMMCFNNREADAVDQSGMIFPATTAS